MKNIRGAGRKSAITTDELNNIIARHENGESLATIAAEYGVSRQALSKRLQNNKLDFEYCIDYVIDNQLCSRIYVNSYRESLRLVHYSEQLSKRAFGWNDNPTWDDLRRLLEEQYFATKGINITTSTSFWFCQDSRCSYFEPELSNDNSNQELPRFEFTRKDILIARTSTDGFQIKALSHDRRFFVKSQAIIGGIIMDDWAVELIASNLCEQLGISHVKQNECQFIYEDHTYKGVYSCNFELDGYTFISFESLINSIDIYSKDEEFVHLGTLDKLKWCASKLSSIGNIPYSECEKYMMDLALIDCLIGNVDRHTHNFGLLYNAANSCYCISPIFDNGMGLFEHDPYRDSYTTYNEAMRSVYVAPYGEDPFDMLDIIDKEYCLSEFYPNLSNISYPSILNKPFVLEYEERMLNYVRNKINK